MAQALPRSASSIAEIAAARLLLARQAEVDPVLITKARGVLGYTGERWTDLHFSIVNLVAAPNRYVAWLDLMGAGHLMSMSMGKSANTIARLHVAVDVAAHQASFKGTRLAINDGIFIVSESKQEIMAVVRLSLAFLGASFLAVTPHNRVMVRASIAYGPVYHGGDLLPHLGTQRSGRHEDCLRNVMFGPPVIQAARHEHAAAPFGVSLHESARAFAPAGTRPFKSTHWGWWTADEYWTPQHPFTDLAELLGHEIVYQYEFLKKNMILHETPEFTSEKLSKYQKKAADYFLGAKKSRPKLI